ncbi:MAG: WD40 repeat domain-containing protein [Gemmataceae bacterium]
MVNYSTAKPQLRYQLLFEGTWPTAVAFVGSGRKLAAANQLGQIFLWDLPAAPPAFTPRAGQERRAPDVPPQRRLDGHTNEITHLEYTPIGQRLVSASLDRTVRLWPLDAATTGKAEVILDGETRRREARRTGKKEPPPAPGHGVAVQTQCRVLEGHRDWIHALGLSADGKHAISGDAAAGVIVWDLSKEPPAPRAKWSGHPWNWIVAASLTADGQTALVSEYRYKRDDFDIPTPALKLWEVPSATEKLDLLKVQFPKIQPQQRSYGAAQVWRRFVANGLITTAIAPDGKLVAVGQGGETETGKVHLLDATTGKLVRSVSGHLNGVTDVLFSPDGKYVISAGRDTSARICQVSDGKEVAVLGTPRGGQFKDWFSAVALSPDGRSLAAADIAGLIHVWEFVG